MDLEVIKIIIEALKLQAKGMQLRSSRYLVKYSQAINDMNAIGWEQWYKSRVATSLSKMFPKYKKKKSTLKIILMYTTVQWKSLWQSRNEMVHGNEASQRRLKKNDRINAELTYIYSRKHMYLAKDRDILLSNLEDHLKLSLSSKQNWLLLYKDYLQDSAKHYRILSKHGTKKISFYFERK